ncbi:MAG TPA: hypothetical protein VLJ14_04350 [Ktedonobacterales bacterium]|nr:hypothetical protein [Ktedonobacterales bacterium]
MEMPRGTAIGEIDAIGEIGAGARLALSPTLHAEVAAPGSPAQRQAARLQAERFARVCGRPQTSEAYDADATSAESATSYERITDYAPRRTLPIVVWRTRHDTHDDTRALELIGTARLELPGAMLIEEMIRLAPGSRAAVELASGRAAEIGAFATAPGLEKGAVLDVVDAIVAIITRLARERDIEWLWLFPRNGLMSLLCARIPGLLPPYRFTRCTDVVGWNEKSPRLRPFRALGLKGLAARPEIYQIRRGDLAADVERRRLLLPARHTRGDEIAGLLSRAMLQARREQSYASAV